MVTVTGTDPAASAGVVTVSDVVEAAVTVAESLPNATASPDAVALNPVPAIVTEVPPAVVPLLGVTEVTTGTATGVTNV